MNSFILTILSIPAVVVLLSNVTLSLFIFIAILPLDSIVIGDIGGIPKLIGIATFAAFLISWAIRKKPIRWDRSLSIYILFLCIGLLSFFWSSNPDLTFEAFITYLLAFMIPFLILNVCEDKRTLHIKKVALAAAGVITVCSGLIDLFQVLGTSGRVVGIVENANGYATWCIITLPGLYWLWAKWRSWLGRVVLITIFAGLLFTILYSLSRGGYISLLVFVLSVVLLSRIKLRTLFLFILIGLLVFGFWPEEQTARFTNLLAGNELRIQTLWPEGIETFLKAPLVGFGLGTNVYIIGREYGRGLSVHSAPLAIAIELGLIGLLPYLFFIISILFQSFRVLKHLRIAQSDLYPLQITMIAAFFAFLFSWAKGGGMEYSKSLFLMSGLLLAINRLGAADIVLAIPQIEPVYPLRLMKNL